MAIAIPSISSSMERSKEKQNESKKKMLASYAEIYVSDNKNAIHKTIGEAGKCYIAISTLKNNGYLSDDANIDADGNNFIGAIVYDSNNNSYEYKEKNQVEDLNINACGDIIDSNETTNTETITKITTGRIKSTTRPLGLLSYSSPSTRSSVENKSPFSMAFSS